MDEPTPEQIDAAIALLMANQPPPPPPELMYIGDPEETIPAIIKSLKNRGL
jgi:hypothetical protein